ncbi:hypothetical protein [Nocardioides sp. 1609]|uniref:hypothetical protein n=1 Tax=Nocardioides sp. 1609 TaxID=2508327 RepID=UPI00106F8D04|nr:hypothetical protein [Nocardioides sp. 1609]
MCTISQDSIDCIGDPSVFFRSSKPVVSGAAHTQQDRDLARSALEAHRQLAFQRLSTSSDVVDSAACVSLDRLTQLGRRGCRNQLEDVGQVRSGEDPYDLFDPVHRHPDAAFQRAVTAMTSSVKVAPIVRIWRRFGTTPVDRDSTTELVSGAS